MADPQGACAGGGEVNRVANAAQDVVDAFDGCALDASKQRILRRLEDALVAAGLREREGGVAKVEIRSSPSVVGFRGVALESVPIGAAIFVEIDTASGRAHARAARANDP